MSDRARALDLAREIENDLSTGYAGAGCLDAERAGLLCRALREACDEVGRLTKERDEQARLVKRLREIASVAARHLESNRNSRRDNHEAGAAVRRELARYFDEAVRP